MRIKRLEMKAFGPFVDRTLEFKAACPGLHIVYGPNEAGKSSCLRALKGLLFGIPERTGDSFIHAYDQLLVGGCLRGEDGRELTFFRRKKRKADLFDEGDHALDPARLTPFLGGMEPEIFASLYGIDHEILVRGGQEILNQKGEVGRTIFAAGAGLTSLHAVLEELEREGDELFKPRASTRRLNEALARYRDLQAQMKKALLSGREWQDHKRALEKAEQRLEEVSRLRGEKDREKRRLERIRQALPHLGQRRILFEKKDELGQVVVLPGDFGERRRQLEQERNEATNRFNAAGSRLEALVKKKAGISLHQGLIDRGHEVEALYQRLGEYRKATADRPKLEGMRIGQRSEAAALLRQIRPDVTLDQAETLRSGLSKKKTIQHLGSRFEALAQSLEQADRDIRKKEGELEKIHAELSRLPPVRDPDALVRALRPAQKAGGLDGVLKEKRRAWALAREDCEGELKRLGLWKGSLAQALGLSMPMPETLNRFEGNLDNLREGERSLGKDKARIEHERLGLSTQLREIRYAGDVPTETDLTAVRSRRDQGWQLLRRQWVEGEDVAEESRRFSSEAPLPEAYEKLVGLSDQTADRLRREADRVQKQASLLAAMESLESRRVQLDRQIEDIHTQRTDAEVRWQALWTPCGIIPLSPREMRSWVSEFERLRFRISEAEKAAGEAEEKEVHRKALRHALIQALHEMDEHRDFPGEELDPVLVHAEAVLDRLKQDQVHREKLESRRLDLQESLKTTRAERQGALEKRTQWRTKWGEALDPLGLGPDATPGQAADFLDTLQTCFDRLKGAADLRKRIEGIDRDNRHFEKDAAHLAVEIAPDLKEAEAARAVTTLQARLNRARQDRAVLEKYLEEIEALEKERVQAQTALKGSHEKMKALLQSAGCESEDLLDDAERRSDEFVQVNGRLSDVEATLAQIAEGVPLARLEAQARDVDPDTLPGRIEALSREMAERLEPDIRRWSEEVGREKNEMARMDGSGRASELAEASQQVLARIRRLTERFIRVRLASGILTEVIEQYRVEHQDPVLGMASGYFKALTLGSFNGLRTDTDDQGQAILIGIRPDGARIKVEGMSHGTRDQLYLALRLATLKWRLNTADPMPFIVDDILINFDDDRSQATLGVLADLAKENQVILFTHHLRIVEAARNMDGKGRVFIHDL